MKSNLFHEISLQKIRIHTSEIKNIIFKDGGDEFSLNGEMYDVKYKSVDGNYIIFYCMLDKKETKLLAGLDNCIKNNSEPVPGNKQSDSKNPVKDLFFSGKHFFVLHSFSFVFPETNFKPESISRPSPSLPPEIFFS